MAHIAVTQDQESKHENRGFRVLHGWVLGLVWVLARWGFMIDGERHAIAPGSHLPVSDESQKDIKNPECGIVAAMG